MHVHTRRNLLHASLTMDGYSSYTYGYSFQQSHLIREQENCASHFYSTEGSFSIGIKISVMSVAILIISVIFHTYTIRWNGENIIV